MPFPPTISSSTNPDADFSLSSTLAQTQKLQNTLTNDTTTSRLLKRQIAREKAALKRDERALKLLREGERGARELAKRKERGLHGIVGRMEEGEEEEEAEGGDEDEENAGEVGGGTRSGGVRSRKHDLDKLTTSTTSHNGAFPASRVPGSTPSLPDDRLTHLHTQLKTHLHSLQKNTTPLLPLLSALSSTQLTLDHFAAKNLDDEAWESVYLTET